MKSKEETVGINNFPDDDNLLSRLFKGMDPDELFADMEKQVKRAVEKHNLNTSDPERLYHVERRDHQFEWSEQARAAVNAFYALHQAKKSMLKNDAKWTAYHMLSVIQHISLYNLMEFGDQILVGDNLLVAQQKGGINSAEERRKIGAEKKKRIVSEGRKLLKAGKNERDLVGILKQKLPFGKTLIREALAEAGLKKGKSKASPRPVESTRSTATIK